MHSGGNSNECPSQRESWSFPVTMCVVLFVAWACTAAEATSRTPTSPAQSSEISLTGISSLVADVPALTSEPESQAAAAARRHWEELQAMKAVQEAATQTSTPRATVEQNWDKLETGVSAPVADVPAPTWSQAAAAAARRRQEALEEVANLDDDLEKSQLHQQLHLQLQPQQPEKQQQQLQKQLHQKLLQQLQPTPRPSNTKGDGGPHPEPALRRSAIPTTAGREGGVDGAERPQSQGPYTTLQKHVEGFVLAGNHDPFLRDINGGSLCVDSAGAEPPGWQLNGTNLTLELCAEIASHQPHIVGFRWGSEALNQEAFAKFVQPRRTFGVWSNVTPLGEVPPVDLKELFGAATEFKCSIYVLDKHGYVPPLNLSAFEELENNTVVEARRLFVQPRRLFFHHTIIHHMPMGHPMHISFGPKGHAGSRFPNHKLHGLGTEYIPPPKFGLQGKEICLQRRPLFKFADPPGVGEMWFCYLPEKRWKECAIEITRSQHQGYIVLAVGVLIVGTLAYIMQNQPHFLIVLSWVANFVVYWELGIVSIAWLLYIGADGVLSMMAFYASALILVLFGGTLIAVPFTCFNAIEYFPVFSMFYMLVLLLLLVVSLDWASYINPAPQLVGFCPLPLGLLGFGANMLKQGFCFGNGFDGGGMLICRFPCQTKEANVELPSPMKYRYIPLPDHNLYAGRQTV